MNLKNFWDGITKLDDELLEIMFQSFMSGAPFPLDESIARNSRHRENGTEYCVVSHYKTDEFISGKLAHLATSELFSSDINEKSDESSLGLDIDKCDD